MIKKHCNENFDLTKEEFPSAICALCRILLTQIENKIADKVPPKMPEYQKIVLLKDTRNKPDCNCFVCQTAIEYAHPTIEKEQGLRNPQKLLIKVMDCLQVLNQ